MTRQETAPRRRGRPAAAFFSGYVDLETACEIVADLLEWDVNKLLVAASGEPRVFFSHAKQNGDRTWKVPAGDVQALLGTRDRAVSARTFGLWWGKSAKSVLRAVQSGMLKKVPCEGSVRIPVSEFTRLMGTPPSAPALFFSRREGGAKR